jgi:hypothetical protein
VNNDESGVAGGREARFSDLYQKPPMNISEMEANHKYLLKIPFSDEEISHGLCNKEMRVCRPSKCCFEPNPANLT